MAHIETIIKDVLATLLVIKIMSNNHNIFVFRKRLLAFSETFIADQSSFLSKYNANLLGFQMNKSGIHLLKKLPIFLLQDNSRFFSLLKLLHRSGLMVGNDWFDKLKQVNAKLIHAHFLNDGQDALKYANHLSIPLITTLHGHDITKKTSSSSLKENQIFFDRVDKVIAVSNYIAQHALKKGCPEHKIIQHSIGIDIEKFTGQKVETNHPSILFVGRLVEKKGVKYLLDAVAKIKNKVPDVSLTIVGDGKLKDELKLQAEELNINVDFVGQKTAEEIKDYLLSHWVFAAPSITAENGDAEGLGMVFLEAQSLKTPVVSFASGGVVEAVENEKTGLLCKEKDVSTLADNLSQLLLNENLRLSFGEAGRKRVENQFNIKHQCEKLELIYDDVIRVG